MEKNINYRTAFNMGLAHKDEWVYLNTSPCITVRSRYDASLIEKIPGTRYTMHHLISPDQKYLAVCTTLNSTVSVFAIESPHRLCFRINLREKPTVHMVFDECENQLYAGVWNKIYRISVPDGKVTCLVEHVEGTLCVGLSCANNSLLGTFWAQEHSGMDQHLLYVANLQKDDATIIGLEKQRKSIYHAFLQNEQTTLIHWGGLVDRITKNEINTGGLSAAEMQIERVPTVRTTLSWDREYLVVASRDMEASIRDNTIRYQTEVISAHSLKSIYLAEASQLGESSISMSGKYLLVADKRSKIIPMTSILG